MYRIRSSLCRTHRNWRRAIFRYSLAGRIENGRIRYRLDRYAQAGVAANVEGGLAVKAAQGRTGAICLREDWRDRFATAHYFLVADRLLVWVLSTEQRRGAFVKTILIICVCLWIGGAIVTQTMGLTGSGLHAIFVNGFGSVSILLGLFMLIRWGVRKATARNSPGASE